jgi:hypothetical protein
MDRFDKFLNRYIDCYVNNDLIQEIIITDENGNDVEKIKNKYGENQKLTLIKNEDRLGPFLNKLKACKYAKNEWIVLMDSDNFAPEEYFITAKKYIENEIKDQKNIILAPSKARPNFNYSHLSGFIYKNGSFKTNLMKENTLIKPENCISVILMNTGNYVINKYLIDNLNINDEIKNINQSSSCDVIYFNTLLFEQLDLNLHVVPNLEYDHVVHNGSIYIQTSNQFKNFSKIIHNRYNNLK